MLLPNLILLIDVAFSTPTGHYTQNAAGTIKCHLYEIVIPPFFVTLRRTSSSLHRHSRDRWESSVHAIPICCC